MQEGKFRTYFIVLVVTAAIASSIIVFAYYGITASLIVAQLIAVPLALGFILESKIRQKRNPGKKEWWTGIVVEEKKVRVRVDWNSCMGSSSCVELAPKVFRLDWTKKKSIFDPAPLELLEESPKTTDPDVVFLAAQSCPYQAIILEDEETKERIFPY